MNGYWMGMVSNWILDIEIEYWIIDRNEKRFNWIIKIELNRNL